MNTVIKNTRLIDPANKIDEHLDILIENGLIKELSKDIQPSKDDEVHEFKDCWSTPGLIDMHTHLREPGQTSKETILTGTKSARAGGYTSVCCMANTNPINDNITTLSYILTQANKTAVANVFPIAAVSKNFEGKELTNIAQLKDNGAVAFSDDGRPLSNMKLYKYALQYSSMFNVPIISHSEDPFLFEGGCMNESFYSTKLGLPAISSASESVTIAKEIELLRYTSGHIHFAHISTKRSVELIRQAKKDGLSVSCETTPHYFTLTDECLSSYNTVFKVNPPLRGLDDQKEIIKGLIDGTIDAIATDHAPHTADEKALDMLQAPFGMTGLETSLGIVLTFLVNTNILSPLEAMRLLTENPAKILHLNRGHLSPGSVADITIIDPNAQWVVDSANFESKAKSSPFDGFNLKGKAITTFRDGIIYSDKSTNHIFFHDLV